MSIFRSRYINKIEKPKRSKKKVKFKPINKIEKPGKYLEDIIEKRYLFISIILVIFFLVIGIKLFNLQILSYDEYSEKLVSATETKIEGSSAPRGRIYDRNYNLLVDNQAIKTIYYKKQDNITTKEEIELAYTVGKFLEIDYSKLSEYRLKNFWYKNNYELARSRISDSEWDAYNHRKLTNQDIESLIFERITEEDLKEYTDTDKEAAYIYYLMNKGYSYAEKIIKNINVTDEEYAYISENIDTLKGFNTKLDWERIYLYGDTFKSILGSSYSIFNSFDFLLQLAKDGGRDVLELLVSLRASEDLREAILANESAVKVGAWNINGSDSFQIGQSGELDTFQIDCSYGGVQMSQLESGLSWIQLFITTAPSLGFLGTVLGMIAAFDAIEVAGDISPNIVAGGMKVALITTVGGLIVAIILQVIYNYLVSKIDSIVNSMEDASISLVDLVVKYLNK